MASGKKLKGALGLAGSTAGAVSAVGSLRRARTDKDKLLLVNAVLSIAVALTGALLAVRAVREDKKK
ncbi:hypothetical protein [Actinophytocola sp.]|uniref:hypothetical protein n=1 Tax=Actinophytocola sp. TaxID=1872138 RepID=UPI002D80B744|nr:hypothetical protein [Actinophytocola sp.]HET9141336.1 hypothetical protein [Actinophytocola sp.]